MTKATILISSARSGTNYFLNVYAKCYQNDFVAKEIFRKGGDSLTALEELLQLPRDRILSIQETNPSELWRRIEKSCDLHSRRAIAKIFYYHVPEDGTLWKLFQAKTRVVHLIRRNAFNAFLSREIAQQTGRWQEFVGNNNRHPFAGRLRLDPVQLENYISSQRAHLSRIRKLYVECDYHEVFYEDISESIECCVAIMPDIFGELDSEAPSSINIERQKKAANEDLVLNYDEVAHFDTNAH